MMRVSDDEKILLEWMRNNKFDAFKLSIALNKYYDAEWRKINSTEERDKYYKLYENTNELTIKLL